MNYWEECIREAFCESEIQASEEQLRKVVEWVEGAHENYGMATGLDVASANWESEESRELKKIKHEAAKKKQWELRTNPCITCTTTGWVLDGWGRDVLCPDCGGNGRV